MRDALRSGGHKRDLLAQRRATLDAAARIVPPDHLAAPTPFNADPLFVAIIDKMFGLLPMEPRTDPDVIRGIAASKLRGGATSWCAK